MQLPKQRLRGSVRAYHQGKPPPPPPPRPPANLSTRVGEFPSDPQLPAVSVCMVCGTVGACKLEDCCPL